MKTLASSVTVFGLAMSLGMLAIACGGADGDESEDGLEERAVQTYEDGTQWRDPSTLNTTVRPARQRGLVAEHPRAIPSPGPQITPAGDSENPAEELGLDEDGDEAVFDVEEPSPRAR